MDSSRTPPFDADIGTLEGSTLDEYRAAHNIAERHATSGAETEDLRQAMVHYRALFDELLEVREPRQEIIAEKRVAAR